MLLRAESLRPHDRHGILKVSLRPQGLATFRPFQSDAPLSLCMSGALLEMHLCHSFKGEGTWAPA